MLPVFTFTDPEVAETAVSNATEPNDEDWSTTLPPIAVEPSPADRSKLPAPTRLEPVLTDKEQSHIFVGIWNLCRAFLCDT